MSAGSRETDSPLDVEQMNGPALEDSIGLQADHIPQGRSRFLAPQLATDQPVVPARPGLQV